MTWALDKKRKWNLVWNQSNVRFFFACFFFFGNDELFQFVFRLIDLKALKCNCLFWIPIPHNSTKNKHSLPHICSNIQIKWKTDWKLVLSYCSDMFRCQTTLQFPLWSAGYLNLNLLAGWVLNLMFIASFENYYEMLR